MPDLSVVIPTMGREILARTVKSVLETNGSENLEIIVAGKISEEIAAEIKDDKVRHFDVSFSSGDSSQKKNLGLKESQADIVAFIDDDVIVSKDWAKHIIDAFKVADVGMVSGPSMVPKDLSFMARLAGLSLSSIGSGYVSRRYAKSGKTREIKWSEIIGCNMAFRKTILNEVGGFEPEFWPGEEMIASYKVSKKAKSIMFLPDAFLFHYPRSTFSGFMRQIYKYGATRIRLDRAGVEAELSTIIPSLWIASLVILGVGAVFSQELLILLFCNLLLYLVFDLIAVLLKLRKVADVLLLLTIPLMHISYGLGQWMELLVPNSDFSEQKTD